MMLLHLPKTVMSNLQDINYIVQYGSSLYNDKPSDIDLAVFYTQIPLKEQLIKSQQIKKEVQKLTYIPIHIQSFTWNSFLTSHNFAKTGILQGIDVITQKEFSLYFDLQCSLHIQYNLQSLSKTEKIRFHYLLHGKQKNGLLQKVKGKLIAPGLIEIPIQHQQTLREKIQPYGIPTSERVVFSVK
ncbi:MAG: hypothetical protein ACMXYK_01925 [Candidatus Woesearchaeota archaeon]